MWGCTTCFEVSPPQPAKFSLRRIFTPSGQRAALGNTRVIFAADYYPYGKILRAYQPCQPNRYLTTHHERDPATGYDNRGARLYDAELGRFLGVDPLAGMYHAWSPYNYVLGNPIRNTDPDGRSVETDYYNLQGKHVKHVDDGIKARKLVLTNSKNAAKVDATITSGGVVPVPSNAVVDQMEAAITATDITGNEHGFYVGNNGGTSITVEGTAGTVDNEAWDIAKADLRAKGDLISYDVHTHPLKKDGNGNVVGIGLPEPSDTDKANVVGNQPNVVLGQTEIIKPLPSGQIGGTPEREYKPTIGFYNANGSISGSPVDFATYKRAVSEINKQ